MQSKLAYIIAGELSGDFIGASIIKTIKERDLGIDFCGIGGEKMKYEGLKSLFCISEINIMGFAEVILKIFRIKNLINKTTEDILQRNPTILITIDSPGFCFRVAKKAKKKNPNIKLLHVIAPSVWAYNPNRAAKIAKIYDHLLCILPFEPPLFEIHGLKSTYIGHPIFDQFKNIKTDKALLRKQYRISDEKKVVGVTLGSRISEINRLYPIFISALNILQSTRQDDIFVVFIVNDENKDFVLEKINNVNINFDYVITTDKISGYSGSDVILAKSGTNTVEISYLKTPLVIAYKLNLFSYMYLKCKMLVKYVSLVNIIENKPIIPEFIQFKCTPKLLAAELSNILDKKDVAKKQVNDSQIAIRKIDKKFETFSIAVDAIIKLLSYNEH